MTVVISYRRSDSEHVVGRMYDRLAAEFPPDSIFRDVDCISVGESFLTRIQYEICSATAVLAVIGPTWASCADERGRKRLSNPRDPVRLELETAIDAGKTPLPVLVSGARMPGASELPAELEPIRERNGQIVRSDPGFHEDMTQLIAFLKEELPANLTGPQQLLNTEVLRQLLEAAHGWYNEVVVTIGQLHTARSREEVRSLRFVYVHSRKFLPTLVTAQRLLHEGDEASGLTRAVDGFLGLLTVRATRGCCCLVCFDFAEPSGSSRWLEVLQESLQKISDLTTAELRTRSSAGRRPTRDLTHRSS